MNTAAVLGLCAIIILVLLISLRVLRKPKQSLVILGYTNIGAPPANSRQKHLWVSREKFKKQLAFLVKKEFKFISARDLLKNNIPPKAVLLTFAYGYDNFYTEALPVLKEFKAPAIVFLSLEGVNTFNFWHDAKKGPWQNLLTSAQIKELKKTKLVDFGAQGLTDINFASAAPETAENEIKESAARLKNLFNINADFFSFPPATSKAPQTAKDLAAASFKLVFADDINPKRVFEAVKKLL